MVKGSAHATCAMLDLSKKPGSLTMHILEKHWKEVHLPEIAAADLVTMLSNSQIEVLPKFENNFNTH